MHLQSYNVISNEVVIQAITWVNFGNITLKRKKQDTKGHILHDFVYEMSRILYP